jgi:hypothetical protein
VAYAFFYDVPGDEHRHEQVKAEIGDEGARWTHRPAGGEASRGGLRHFNVWKSKEDWERFQEASVGLAVARVLSRIGATEAPPPPGRRNGSRRPRSARITFQRLSRPSQRDRVSIRQGAVIPCFSPASNLFPPV